VVDTLKSARLDVTRTAGWWFSSVEGGLNYDDRTKDKIQPEASLVSDANCPCQIASQYLLPATNLGFSGTPSSLSWNVPAVLANYFQPIHPSTTANSSLVGKTWDVTEKLSTAYIKGNLKQDLSADVALRGNIGVQVIHTQQQSSSEYWNSTLNGGAGGASPTAGGRSYNDVLPSANLVFQLPAQQAVRVGLSRETVRPRMDEMADSFEYGVSQVTGYPSASGGNPNLAPWRAKAVDLSYEKYFESKAYVSAAVFYKKLTSYIYQIGEPYNFAALNGNLAPGYLGTGLVAQDIGTFTIYQNGQGGRVDGGEIAVSLPGDMLTDYLTGFGMNGSISETSSSITIPGTIAGTTATNITLPGLSKTVWQATLYYERYGFSARIATRYRSNYVGEITDYAGDRALEYVRHEQITDFQTGYDFLDGRLKGLSLVFQIDNMTNTPFIDYASAQARVRDYETYGRVFFLGAKYKL
jgi:iron complex outermembrane receptor protein